MAVGFLQFGARLKPYSSRMKSFATLGAGLLYFLLGALWYAPFAFGPAFNEALGYAPGVVPPNTPAMFIGPFVGCLAAAVGLAVLIRWTRFSALREVLLLSALVATLFSASAVGIDAVAPNQSAPMTLLLIVGGYHFVGQLLVGGVLWASQRTRAVSSNR